jgi:hypothetical protein
MTTWAQVHAGDTVRGADQRPWLVTRRGLARHWVVGGEDAPFVLRHGEREVRVARRLDEPVDLMSVAADRADVTAAASALIAGGLMFDILEETVPDPFSSAAAEPKHDRFGRYLLPDPVTGKERAWTRVSTIARTLADEYHLGLWKQRMVARGMALRPDLVAGAAAVDPDADKDTLNSVASQAMEAAESKRGANLGTALHTFTQRLDRGEALSALRAPAPLDADLHAYLDAYRAARLTVEQVERVVVLPDLGVAGRFDRIVRQPAGAAKAEPLAVLDLKSGKDLSYGWLEIAIQQALYAHAPLMWDPVKGCYEPMPAVDQNRALVLHLPVGRASAQLYGVNIIEGWRLARLAMDVRAARSAAKTYAWLVEPDDPATLALHNVSRAGSREELAALWERLNARGLWTEEVNAAALDRYASLQIQSELNEICAEEATWK